MPNEIEGADRQDILVDEERPQDAFVYLKLHGDDFGSPVGRGTTREFLTRKPECVKQFDQDVIVVEIANVGRLMSGLVIVEHQFVFCSYAGHQAGDGFQTVHAGEASASTADALATAASVPPQGAIRVTIKVPRPQGVALANLYFRCRLTSLGSRPVPKDRWDFLVDPRVTEAHLRIA